MKMNIESFWNCSFRVCTSICVKSEWQVLWEVAHKYCTQFSNLRVHNLQIRNKARLCTWSHDFRKHMLRWFCSWNYTIPCICARTFRAKPSPCPANESLEFCIAVYCAANRRVWAPITTPTALYPTIWEKRTYSLSHGNECRVVSLRGIYCALFIHKIHHWHAQSIHRTAVYQE